MKVLIFRIGSVGDTVVALPALRLVAYAFPDAHRIILTNDSVGIGKKEASPASILGDSGLAHDFIRYPPGLASPLAALKLAKELRRRRFDLLVYLMPPRLPLNLLRDEVFFRLSGIRRIVGLNYGRDFHDHLYDPRSGLYEAEASRLLRSVAKLGKVDLSDPSWWDLGLSPRERGGGAAALADWPGANRYVAASVGTKVDVKDWGEDRWLEWAQHFSAVHPELGLVLIGALDEVVRSDRLAVHWQGPSLNLCSRLTPRESAAVLERAVFYIGHDSGPMHLAAAAGTPCIAIFAARNKPGVWFPCGRGHTVLYHQTPCFGCGLSICTQYDKQCIRAIQVEDVLQATEAMWTQEAERGRTRYLCQRAFRPA
jgi:heptosyltransferase-3